MITHGSINQNSITRLGQVAGDIQTLRYDTNSGGSDKHTIALAALHHLSITSDYRHTSFRSRLAHAGNDAFQISQWKALFQYKTSRQVKRFSAGHGHIVYRSVHSK